MPSSTTKGFPYPVGSDPLADTDVAIKALADFLEANNFRIKVGTALVDIVTTNVTASLAVLFASAFPVGVTPTVILTVRSNTAPNTRFATVSGETNTGFSITAINTLSNSDVSVAWVAFA